MSDFKKYLLMLFAAFLLVFGAWKAIGVLGKVGKTIVKKSIADDGLYSTEEVRNTIIPNPFEAIDEHARNAPPEVEKSIKGLAKYLAKNAQTDLEKARAAYVWIANNISYDDDAFNSNTKAPYTPDKVLQKRKAVCAGFSKIYEALGNEMGLEIKGISGYAKGYGYKIGNRFTKVNHGWNIIRIDGHWRVFDVTWGRGSSETIDGKLVSNQSFNDYWFNADPYETIFNHYPENPKYLLVEPPISLREYEQFPEVNGTFFGLGFDGKDIYHQVRTNPNLELPKKYKVSTYVKMENAPVYKTLQKNQSYHFEFYAPNAYRMSMIDADNNWTHFKEKNGTFYIDFTPKRTGLLTVSIKQTRKGRSSASLLAYKVIKGDVPI